MVRVILVDTTFPVKIRPRMEMSPVKGHFLSIPMLSTYSDIEYASRLKHLTTHTNVGSINGF